MSDTEPLDVESACLIVQRNAMALDHFRYVIAEAKAGRVDHEQWWKSWRELDDELIQIERSANEFRHLAQQTDVALALARQKSQDVVDDYQAETAEQRKP